MIRILMLANTLLQRLAKLPHPNTKLGGTLVAESYDCGLEQEH